MFTCMLLQRHKITLLIGLDELNYIFDKLFDHFIYCKWTCGCAHLGYLVVHAFYNHLPFSLIDSATFIYCAIDLITDLNLKHK